MESAMLVTSRICPAAALPGRVEIDDAALAPSDPAYRALTDFTRDCPITVHPERAVDDALRDMVRVGVHALLVTQAELGGTEQQIVGLITSYDIEGERWPRFPQVPHRRSRAESRVRDVMVSWDELTVIKYESLRSMTAAELYEMFQGTGLTHLLVVEIDHGACGFARGLISRAALAQRLCGSKGARYSRTLDPVFGQTL